MRAADWSSSTRVDRINRCKEETWIMGKIQDGVLN
jgi:hypothetical protein